MDAGTVFVWRVRLCLLAAALGLMHLGADKPTPVPQSMVRGQPIPTIQAVGTLSSKAGPVQFGNRAVSQSLAEPLKRARPVVVPQSLDARSSGRAAKSPDGSAARRPTRAQKSVATKLSGSGKSIKSRVSGQRKSLTAGSKKREISMPVSRNAESLKARQKVAQKGDAKAGDNVGAPRQPRNRLHA